MFAALYVLRIMIESATAEYCGSLILSELSVQLRVEDVFLAQVVMFQQMQVRRLLTQTFVGLSRAGGGVRSKFLNQRLEQREVLEEIGMFQIEKPRITSGYMPDSLLIKRENLLLLVLHVAA